MSPDDFNERLRGARQSMQLEHYSEALGQYAKLVKQYPRDGVWGEYGRAAAVSGDFELATRIWKKLREYEVPNAQLLSQLAWEHQNIRQHAEARALYAEAVKLEPRNLDLQLELASTLVKTDSIAEARVAVDRCIALAPQDLNARYLTAHLDRLENKFAEAERQFHDLLSAGLTDPYVIYCCHSELATLLERTNRPEEAITQLEKGKNILRQSVDDREDRMSAAQREQANEQARSLPKNILERWGKTFPPGSRTRFPPVALLTGSARSGTTLLEKILDAHPRVAANDESLAFQMIPPRVNLEAPVISSQTLNLLRQRYIKNLTHILGKIEKQQTILDKNPSRTDWLPAFLRVFPELRVIIALRDPRDIMVSLYFQNHSRTNHLTMERLAIYYRNVMDMWLIVREWEGLAWLETRYEDVVADLEKEGSRVTQFLGLAWNENQARFFEKNREKPVMSTNHADVTKPVYKRAVGRWQAYEKQLALVLPLLEPYCQKFGYA